MRWQRWRELKWYLSVPSRDTPVAVTRKSTNCRWDCWKSIARSMLRRLIMSWIWNCRHWPISRTPKTLINDYLFNLMDLSMWGIESQHIRRLLYLLCFMFIWRSSEIILNPISYNWLSSDTYKWSNK